MKPFGDRRTHVSAPDDFLRSRCSQIRAEDWRGLIPIPYCFDFSSLEILYTSGIDPITASASVMHYEYLRENATRLISLPWEVRLGDPKMDYQKPVFLFSMGRCGSTLLANLIRAMGTTCLSEPDIYAQAVLFAARCAQLGGVPSAIYEILARATEDLLAPLPRRPVVIKLRVDATISPQIILSVADRRPRVIFLMRHYQSWAKSFLRVGNDNLGAAGLGRIYQRTLSCYRYLQDHADCMLVKYEELRPENSDLLDGIAAHLGLAKPQNLDSVFGREAQAGTHIQQLKESRTVSRRTIEEIREWWRTNLRDAIEAPELQYVTNEIG